jgi:hypothetical protein
MRHVVITLAFLASGAPGLAQDLTGANCQLGTPPGSAGESQSHGALMKVHPRAKDIGPEYSGCQSTWVEGEKGWSLVARTEIAGGDPVRVVVVDGSYAACRYRGGKLIAGTEAECADPRFLLVRSFPPGCVAKLRAAAARGGPGMLPAECEVE